MYIDQDRYDVRCEWGTGIEYLLATSDVVIIVDVLSFSTAVDIATARDAIVYPYGPLAGAEAFAAQVGARLALPRWDAGGGYSLSPVSLLAIPAGTRLVLPSPNGSALSAAVGGKPAICGCLRNASAVARAAREAGTRISVIPAGERWPDGSLRPALEDLIGAGAIISHLKGTRSPEAEVAALAFGHYRERLADVLAGTGSGQELSARGFGEDVWLASMLDVSENVPVLREGA